MALRLYVIISAATAGFVRGVENAARSLDRLEREETQAAKATDQLEREFRETRKELHAFGADADRAAAIFAAGWKRAAQIAGTVISTLALRDIAEAGDRVRLLAAQLEALGAGAGSLEGLLDVADRLGVEVETVAEAFRRFAIARQELGLTTEETLRLTEVVLGLGRLSGASATELSAGAIQLAQALASGRLQGDELRSVLENMPLLARELARQLGVSVGKLRQMGAEGELSGRRVAKALLRVADGLDERLAQLPDTLDRAEARISNAWDRLLAALDSRLHVSDVWVFFEERLGLLRGESGERVVGAGGFHRTRADHLGEDRSGNRLHREADRTAPQPEATGRVARRHRQRE